MRGVGQASATLLVDANAMVVKLPGKIHLKPNGSEEVEVYGSATLDVRSIDLTSLRVAGAAPAVDKRGRMNVSFKDRNRDGLLDLEIDVARAGLVLTPGLTVVPVTLTLTDRCTHFAGAHVTMRKSRVVQRSAVPPWISRRAPCRSGTPRRVRGLVLQIDARAGAPVGAGGQRSAGGVLTVTRSRARRPVHPRESALVNQHS